MTSPDFSSSNQLLLEKFLNAVQQKAQSNQEPDSTQVLTSDLFSDVENFPKLLNDVITQLKKEKIHFSEARIIAATACEMLEMYTLNHVYQKGEEENLKQVIKLLGFLILGAIKTPITEKVEKLPLSDTANLLILLYSNIQENPQPLGQVQSLYAVLRERLSFNKKLLEWSKEYLEQQGFNSIEIKEILESKEDIDNR